MSIVELQEVVLSGSLDSGEFTVRISDRGMDHLVALAVAEKLGISIDDVWNAGKIEIGVFDYKDGHYDSARVRFALKRGQTSERAASWLDAYRGAKKVACEVIEEGRRETTSVVVPLPSGLEVSDAGVAHNDAVLAMLRDLEPAEGDKAALVAKRAATIVEDEDDLLHAAGDEDFWTLQIDRFDEPTHIVNDERDRVSTYLRNVDNLWSLKTRTR